MRLSMICTIVSVGATIIGAIADVVGRRDEIREIIEEDYDVKKKEKESD